MGSSLQDHRVYNTFSSIYQFNAQSYLELYASNAVKFEIGGKISYTKMKPFNTNVAADFIDKPDDFSAFPPISFNKLVLYYENEIKAGNKLF
jgi:hypothetical protein